MEPNGQLSIVFVKDIYNGSDVPSLPAVLIMSFKDLDWWRPEAAGVWVKIKDQNRRTFWPWHMIARIDVKYNSDEYVAWANDQHGLLESSLTPSSFERI